MQPFEATLELKVDETCNRNVTELRSDSVSCLFLTINPGLTSLDDV